jgi:hypothetical protein
MEFFGWLKQKTGHQAGFALYSPLTCPGNSGQATNEPTVHRILSIPQMRRNRVTDYDVHPNRLLISL